MSLKLGTYGIFISIFLSGFFVFVPASIYPALWECPVLLVRGWTQRYFAAGCNAPWSKGGVYAQEADKKQELEQQIEQLESEAKEIDVFVQQAQGEARTLANETKIINGEIKQRELEIKRLTLAINKTGLEIKNKSAGIVELGEKISKNKKSLGAALFLLYSYDKSNILLALLKNQKLSDFFGTWDSLKRVQSNIQEALSSFKEEKTLFEKEKAALEEFNEEQQGLKALQEVERRSLAQKKKEKEELVRLTKGKEAIFQQLLQSKKRDITTLKTQLFYLEKTGITAEDAIRFAELAAERTGIRPAFLLALLEVETGKQFEDGVISVGTNLGTGNWKRDMYDCYIKLGKRSAAEAQKNAFFAITGKLNLDPDKMPVSRKPSYGCGGAMGPAQFLPTTWLLFEKRVAELTGHNPPSPWNIEDAFTASAVFLAQSGAASKTAAGEMRAAKTYISGSPTCSRYICNSYANRIATLARDIDRIL